MGIPNGLERKIVERTRLTALTAFGRYPSVFRAIASLGSNRAHLVGPDTDLCIEAPPRSGNSFLVTGFTMANPAARLAHHHHVPAQVLNAIALRVPVITLLRNPIDSALAKAAPTMEPFLIGTTLRRWLSFWDVTEPVLPEIVAAPFEQLIADPASLIAKLNAKYGTTFSVDFPKAELVFDAMERSRLARVSKEEASRPNPNIPDERITATESLLRSVAEQHQLAPRALERYQRLRSGILAVWSIARQDGAR